MQKFKIKIVEFILHSINNYEARLPVQVVDSNGNDKVKGITSTTKECIEYLSSP